MSSRFCSLACGFNGEFEMPPWTAECHKEAMQRQNNKAEPKSVTYLDKTESASLLL